MHDRRTDTHTVTHTTNTRTLHTHTHTCMQAHTHTHNMVTIVMTYRIHVIIVTGSNSKVEQSGNASQSVSQSACWRITTRFACRVDQILWWLLPCYYLCMNNKTETSGTMATKYLMSLNAYHNTHTHTYITHIQKSKACSCHLHGHTYPGTPVY